MSTTLTDRTLYYYDLDFNPYKKYEGVEFHYEVCFKKIAKLLKDKDEVRFQFRGGTRIFLNSLTFSDTDNFIRGKLYKVRDDIFPEVFDFQNEAVNEFQIGDERGLVEATHFLIEKRTKQSARLIVEYNHYGARTWDLIWYIFRLSKETGVIKGVKPVQIVKDDLTQLKSRIDGIKNFHVKVHKNNISRIEAEDKGLWSSVKAAQDFSASEYVSLTFSFDYKNVNTSAPRSTIFGWIDKFVQSPDKKEIFDVFSSDAEDSDKEDQIEKFNLLLNKEKSLIKVQKKIGARIIISSDFYEKAIEEYQNKFQIVEND